MAEGVNAGWSILRVAVGEFVNSILSGGALKRLVWCSLAAQYYSGAPLLISSLLLTVAVINIIIIIIVIVITVVVTIIVIREGRGAGQYPRAAAVWGYRIRG